MRNEGTLDRALRGIGGLVLLALAWLGGLEAGWAIWGATAVAAVLLVTAAVGFCPAYRLLGVKTCEDC